MPIIYLSPSTQPNKYLGGGEEQYYMNQIADAMQPYLRTNGIKYVRSKPGASLGQIIRESNSEYYDLHLALNSNASPENLSGRLMGTDIFYFTYGVRAKRAAEVIAKNLKNIYHDPVLVKAIPTTEITEISKTNAPAILVKTAYHDNEQDVDWLKSHIDIIAVNLVEAITLYFNIPFISSPKSPMHGTVETENGTVSISRRPDSLTDVILQVPNNTPITILGEWQGWYVVEYKDHVGYASAKYITA